ncbi:MAG: hypothetical protein D6702_07230, partial [Planctomycetota bacterium]
MHPRTLSILPLLVLAALLGACAHGGSGLFGVVSGAGSTPPFTTADLAGAWTGVLTPVPPTNGPANGATDPYPFYVRFDAAGMPTEGADGRGWDWDLAITSNNAAVNKQGDLLVEISGNGAVNVLKLFGTLSADKQVQTGTYTISKHLNVIEEGNYVLTRSSGPGHFSIADQVAGSWTGIGYRKSTNRFRDLLLDVDASGSVIGGELVGEHVFIQNGVNTPACSTSSAATTRSAGSTTSSSSPPTAAPRPCTTSSSPRTALWPAAPAPIRCSVRASSGSSRAAAAATEPPRPRPPSPPL